MRNDLRGTSEHAGRGVVLESLEAPPRTGIFGVEAGSLVELHPAEGSSFSPACSPTGETVASRIGFHRSAKS
ncbi:hypothetical protein [Microbacterium saperdae]|uniref:Uncharacterized protein n=1 Tax=Microbacterium saperdae TaxID=69368 RepID=A0A543BK31_9MICO|nr:hypothetical protein [Microbacterium saperdae]TQL85200.1 hypothetical protein FB560_0805 [Microbacterium saperdae]GGM56140.1 hypothetical protein GCM10010489_29700 [Microbacterium saperdae]